MQQSSRAQPLAAWPQEHGTATACPSCCFLADQLANLELRVALRKALRAPVHLAEKHPRGSQRLVTVVVQSEQPRGPRWRPPRTPFKVNDVAAVVVRIKGNAELVHRRKLPCKKGSLPSPERSRKRTGGRQSAAAAFGQPDGNFRQLNQ